MLEVYYKKYFTADIVWLKREFDPLYLDYRDHSINHQTGKLPKRLLFPRYFLWNGFPLAESLFSLF